MRKGISAPVFKIDTPNYLPIAIPLTLTDLMILLVGAMIGAKIGGAVFGLGGYVFGVFGGAGVTLSGIFGMRRLFPGPTFSYFVSWLQQKDFYSHLPEPPDPPLIVYVKRQ